MKQTHIGHLQINIDGANRAFYKELTGLLGWQPMYEDDTVFGVGGGNGAGIWFMSGAKAVSNDYDGPGLNHLSFSTETRHGVDETVAFLQDHDIPPLFETPRDRPEFTDGDNSYYQVMFESPDRILFEVVCTGPLLA